MAVVRSRNKLANRNGFSLLELSMVTLIAGIGAAVVTPKWSAAVEQARVSAMRTAFENDMATLRRASVRMGREIELSVWSGTSVLEIFPESPEILGDENGQVDYGKRFPGVTFGSVDFDSNEECSVDLYGQLLSSATGERLTAAVVELQGAASTQSIDLLSRDGLASVASESASDASSASANSTSSSSISSFFARLFGG